RERSPREHAGEPAAVLGVAVDVAPRLGLLDGRARGLLGDGLLLLARKPLEPLNADWPRAGAAERDVDRGTPACGIERDRRGDAGEREVAEAPRDLEERDAVPVAGDEWDPHLR